MKRPLALLVDDDAACIEVLTEIVNEQGFESRTAATLAEAEEMINSQAPDVLMLDLFLPDGQSMDLLGRVVKKAPGKVILMTGYASVQTAVDALRLGAHDYLVKPVDWPRVRSMLELLFQSWLLKDLDGNEKTASHFPIIELLGKSAAILDLKQKIARVAPTDASVFITGETGTGKGMVAEHIHALSPRCGKPFVAVSCSSLSTNLLESELFGHERGSFTGATRRHQGYFERSDGGTLFLDEITEMPIELQSKLLKVLETGKFTRVGGDDERTVDVRIIAASNRRPATAVLEDRMRQDLLYRLSVFPIFIAPLRNREGDILLLADDFLYFLNSIGKSSKRLTASCRSALQSHSWPGNVRELKNSLRHAYILADRDIEPEFLIASDIESERALSTVEGGELGSAPHTKVPLGDTMAQAEKRIILATLEHCAGHRGKTAATLAISPKTLYNRLVDYGIA